VISKVGAYEQEERWNEDKQDKGRRRSVDIEQVRLKPAGTEQLLDFRRRVVEIELGAEYLLLLLLGLVVRMVDG